MIKFDVLNRFSGAIQFTAEIDCADSEPHSWKLRLAVQWAIKTGADLSDTDLSGAKLSDTDLSGADLSGAKLSGAKLNYTDLSDTDLSGADLRRAKLNYAKLSGAKLSDTDLSDTDLSGADLSGAKLSGAKLSDTDLSDTDLRRAKEDFLREVLKMPGELEFLRDAIRNGKINGSVYEGECACLAGTLSKATGKSWSIFKDDSPIAIDASSPRERFFMGIAEGDTPETNPISAIALEWTNKAISIRDSKKETNQ
jgi:uncharacterized protein YjbI with pentapeptide repeats